MFEKVNFWKLNCVPLDILKKKDNSKKKKKKKKSVAKVEEFITIYSSI
jgi:hypothetical protein